MPPLVSIAPDPTWHSGAVPVDTGARKTPKTKTWLVALLVVVALGLGILFSATPNAPATRALVRAQEAPVEPRADPPQKPEAPHEPEPPPPTVEATVAPAKPQPQEVKRAPPVVRRSTERRRPAAKTDDVLPEMPVEF
jgi:hypothetical protein